MNVICLYVNEGDPKLRSVTAVLSETNELVVHFSSNHKVVGFINDVGLVTNSASFWLDGDKKDIEATEMHLMNNPYYPLDLITYQPLGTRKFIINKWFNAFGSGGGNLEEPTTSTGINLADFGSLEDLTGIKMQVANLGDNNRTYIFPVTGQSEITYWTKNVSNAWISEVIGTGGKTVDGLFTLGTSLYKEYIFQTHKGNWKLTVHLDYDYSWVTRYFYAINTQKQTTVQNDWYLVKNDELIEVSDGLDSLVGWRFEKYDEVLTFNS